MEITTGFPTASSLRWRILRQAFLRRRSSEPDTQSQMGIKHISRKALQGFNMIPHHIVDDHLEEDSGSLSKINHLDGSKDTCACYMLPTGRAPKIFLYQRIHDHAELSDFEICSRYDIDNTGLVCHWPSEDVLAYFCLLHADMFRSKRVIELGSGYGLAGLVIATVTEASEVVISDGNPGVIDYIQRNICANAEAFDGTQVKALTLHWNLKDISTISNVFDVIVASDCTFFKEFHSALAQTVKCLLNPLGPSEALFFGPKRGDSLDNFLKEIKDIGLHYGITENYDAEVWKRHQRFLSGDDSWPNYEMDHCYPLLVRITL